MTECYAYGCENDGTELLRAWGPGEDREFCPECAEVRRQTRGYTDE